MAFRKIDIMNPDTEQQARNNQPMCRRVSSRVKKPEGSTRCLQGEAIAALATGLMGSGGVSLVRKSPWPSRWPAVWQSGSWAAPGWQCTSPSPASLSVPTSCPGTHLLPYECSQHWPSPSRPSASVLPAACRLAASTLRKNAFASYGSCRLLFLSSSLHLFPSYHWI